MSSVANTTYGSSHPSKKNIGGKKPFVPQGQLNKAVGNNIQHNNSAHQAGNLNAPPKQKDFIIKHKIRREYTN
jgi:hypothetical protein